MTPVTLPRRAALAFLASGVVSGVMSGAGVAAPMPGIADRSDAAQADTLARLIVQVHCGKPAIGQVVGTLYNSPETFLEEPQRREAAPVGEDGMAMLIFDDLAPGSYALSVIHDADMNGRLDRNFLGIPRERLGFSNGYEPRTRRPTFDETRFPVEAGDVTIEIKLIDI